MTTWNNLTFLQFMDLWKDIRHSLTGSPAEAIEQLIESFRLLPIETGRHIDPYSPDTWTTPWEQIQNRQFCQSGIGLFMYWSLRLSEIKTDNLELWYIEMDGIDVLVPVFVERNKLTVFDVVCMECKEIHTMSALNGVIKGNYKLYAKYNADTVPNIS